MLNRHPLLSHFPHLALNVPQRNKDIASDTSFSAPLPLMGEETMAQVCMWTKSHTCHAYGVPRRSSSYTQSINASQTAVHPIASSLAMLKLKPATR